MTFTVRTNFNKCTLLNHFKLRYRRQTMKGYGGLSEHEIMTVARHYCDRKESEIDMKLVLAVAQEKLKKGAFEVRCLFVHF